MAYISSIGDIHHTCLTFDKLDNALKVVGTLLLDEESADDKTGQYAIMVSLEENLFRLDIVDTFSEDPVIFGSAYQVEQEMRKEILGDDDDDRY